MAHSGSLGAIEALIIGSVLFVSRQGSATESKQPGYSAQAQRPPITAAQPVPRPTVPPQRYDVFVAGSGVLEPGLQQNGAYVVNADGNATAFELSSPLYPCSYDMHQVYPRIKDDPTALRDLLAKTTIDFNFLVENCSKYYPLIKPPGRARSLSMAERITNFVQAEECRFDPYYSKGYWIPEAIERTDVCAISLGGDWHLPTQAEITRMTEAQRRALANPVVPKGLSLGRAHDLHVYALRSTGELAIADLASGRLAAFYSQAGPQSTPGYHFEGRALLRCLRYPATPDPPALHNASCEPTMKGGRLGKPTEPNAQVSSASGPAEQREFERKMKYHVERFEQFANIAKRSRAMPLTLREYCQSAQQSVPDITSELRRTLMGHVVLPSWQTPLDSPSIARMRGAAARLRPLVDQTLAETQQVVDYCVAHANIPPCRRDLKEAQEKELSYLKDARKNLAVILAR